MTSSRRRVFLYGLVSAVAAGLLVGGYGLYWQQVATRLEAGVGQWAADQRNAGATVDFHWRGISGFPFAFTADFTGVNILGRLGGVALSARTDHLQLNMSPIDLNVVRLLCDSPLTVIVPGLSLGQNAATPATAQGTGAPVPGTQASGDQGSGQQPTDSQSGAQQPAPAQPGAVQPGAAQPSGARLILDQADGNIRLRDGNPVGTTIDVSRGKLDNGQSVLSAASLHLDVQLPPTQPHDFNDPAATVAIAVSGVDMPANVPQLLPGPILQADLAGTIKGPLLPPPGVELPHDLAGFLAHWRDAGGVLDLSKFDFAQGPLSLTGNGTLALDANLQPIGAGKITATGLGDLIDLLAARGAMHRKDAGIAKAVINGMEKPGANGRPEVTIGLSIQDSVVSFGFARLFKLPPVIWP
ncbi:MAG TPA: DUF2125 domain-containing protein [Dongiaceae bacterium]|nr:DUF2125 domain-containing protein [Dongiaceae bacterium]